MIVKRPETRDIQGTGAARSKDYGEEMLSHHDLESEEEAQYD
jgi:hypothetical protein